MTNDVKVAKCCCTRLINVSRDSIVSDNSFEGIK